MLPPTRPERTYALIFDGYRREDEQWAAYYPIGSLVGRTASFEAALELIQLALDDPSICFRCGGDRPTCECVTGALRATG